MSRTDKYIAPFSVAGMGLIFLASPLFLNLGTALPSYLASQEISSQQEQQRKELAERKKTSDKIRQTGLPVAGDTLTVYEYLDNPNKLPVIKQSVLNRYADSQAWVFDEADQCIGRIIKGRFVSKYKAPTTCKEIPDNGTR
jgi:hypothetical protein